VLLNRERTGRIIRTRAATEAVFGKAVRIKAVIATEVEIVIPTAIKIMANIDELR